MVYEQGDIIGKLWVACVSTVCLCMLVCVCVCIPCVCVAVCMSSCVCVCQVAQVIFLSQIATVFIVKRFLCVYLCEYTCLSILVAYQNISSLF